MNHVEIAATGRNSLWRYLVMLVAIVIAINTVGAIPLLIGYVLKMFSDPNAINSLASDPNNLSLLGYSPNITLLMMLFPFAAGLVAFFLLIKPLHGRTVAQVFNGTGTIRWSRILTAAFVWLMFSIIFLVASTILQPDNFRINNTGPTLVLLVIITLVLIPFQAGFEEVIFRGYLLQALSIPGMKKPKTAFFKAIYGLYSGMLFPLLITSILFGILHSWNPEVKAYGFFTMMPQYVMFGLLFGILTVLDDGIEIAVGTHAANNAFLSIMVTNSSSALQTPAVFEQISIYPWSDFISLFVLSLLYILVMKMIYGWKDFSVIWRKLTREGINGQTV
ncbi:MAG: CPBP family intramembrane glutamic endopeptidase [Bacteroidales bacterium]